MIKIEENTYSAKHIYFTTGDGGEYAGNKLRIAFYKWYISIDLPFKFNPYVEKHPSTLRPGQFWEEKHSKQYGVSLCDNHFSVYYGAQTDDSSTSKQKGWFLPWSEWRRVRYEFYAPDGTSVARADDDKNGRIVFDKIEYARSITPKVYFRFKDFDGEEITVETYIEEMEWRLGTGLFKWLSWFAKPKIRRSLDLAFDKQVGREKGSWKGGTLGHSVDMLPGETPFQVFVRYGNSQDFAKYYGHVNRDFTEIKELIGDELQQYLVEKARKEKERQLNQINDDFRLKCDNAGAVDKG